MKVTEITKAIVDPTKDYDGIPRKDTDSIMVQAEYPCTHIKNKLSGNVTQDSTIAHYTLVNGEYILPTEKDFVEGSLVSDVFIGGPIPTQLGDLVNSLIRSKYTESEEFAILRQRERKPEEYTEYDQWCENCKTIAKGYLQPEPLL